MKKILGGLIVALYVSGFVLFFSASCSDKKEESAWSEPKPDALLGQRVFECDSALNVRDMQVQDLRDSLSVMREYKVQHIDTVQVDSLKRELFIANYKLAGVRKYVKICDRNPSQVKFLRGWIHRAID